MPFNDKLKVSQRKENQPSDVKPSGRILYTSSKAVLQKVRMHPQSMTPSDALALHRTMGNRAVGQLIRESCGINDNQKPMQRKQSAVVQTETEKSEDVEQVQLKKENNTGLPDALKAGVEDLSGIDMSGVKVHYNSDKPSQLGALAYTQGTDIHVAPGEERHLPHEAWHVVQQAQGRVNPTMQLKGMAVNDDAGLEQEADEMGARAIQAKAADNRKAAPVENRSANQCQIVQKMLAWDSKNNLLFKNGRLDFQYDLQQAMPVKSGQHRCHTIGYEIICNGVKDPINACLRAGKDVALGALDGLLEAVYPNGSKTRLGTSHNLQVVAQKYYKQAQTAIANISTAIATGSPKVVDYANDLIDALNNSPDNLRPGDGSTNSSIQEALDLVPGSVETLQADTLVCYGKVDKKTIKLPDKLEVIRAGDALQEQQLETLLTKTYSESGQVWIFSSGKQLQSSDYINMTSATMTKTNPQHFAIKLSNGVYLLFDW